MTSWDYCHRCKERTVAADNDVCGFCEYPTVPHLAAFDERVIALPAHLAGALTNHTLNGVTTRMIPAPLPASLASKDGAR